MQKNLHHATLPIIAVMLGCFAVTTCFAQELVDPSPHQNAKGEYLGSIECSQCHENPSTRDELNNITDFVALNEFKLWIETDVHARSFMQIIPNESMFKSLKVQYTRVQSPKGVDPMLEAKIVWSKSNDLSAAMCEKLGYEPESLNSNNLEGTDFARDCLTCHAGYEHKTDSLTDEVKLFGVGVGCESCHGPSSKWKEEHAKSTWRGIDPLEKHGKFGMIDVRNSAVRSTQCLSCHVGNEKEHKVVTHRMYAAGHPPLPGIEVESFSKQMSQHWSPLSEKYRKTEVDEVRSSLQRFAEINNQTVSDFSESRSVVIGAVAALRESLALTSGIATSDSFQWPEFASFDCAACHHDLRADSWRQERGFRGRPGRPMLHAWPDALVKVGIVSIARSKNSSDEKIRELLAEYKELRAEIQTVLDDQPFGKAAELATAEDDGAAKKLVTWIDEILWSEDGERLAAEEDLVHLKEFDRIQLTNGRRRLSLPGFDQKQAIETLKLLSGANPDYFDPREAVYDFNSARQLAWAIRAIANELMKPGNANELPFDQDAVTALVDKLSLDLHLTLPGGSGKITEKQKELFESIYGFTRQGFLDDLETLRTSFDSQEGLRSIESSN